MKTTLIISLSAVQSLSALNENKISSEEANSVLISDDYAMRSKRANSHLFEEIGSNNMQQECIDEVCNFEEFLEAWNDQHGTREKVAEITKKNAQVTFSVDDDDSNGDPAQIYKRLSNPCSFKDCHNTQTEVCENYWNQATCNCFKGYTGDLCEKDINECEVNNDLCNHGICANLIGSYECSCDEGWSGLKCDLDEDECLQDNICGMGTCENTEGSFNCTCPEGWRGQHCEIDVNECEDEVLQHNCNENQYCKNLLGSFECNCKGGFTGDACGEDLDECSLPGVCPPGSVCSTPEFNSYSCACPVDGCSFP